MTDSTRTLDRIAIAAEAGVAALTPYTPEERDELIREATLILAGPHEEPRRGNKAWFATAILGYEATVRALTV